MKFILIVCLMIMAFAGCNGKKSKAGEGSNDGLATLLEKYYEERLQFFPLEATAIGDNRYNDILPIEFTDSYRSKLHDFYTRYLIEINKYNRDELSKNDKLSFDVFTYEMKMNKEGLAFQDNYIPFNQFYALPLSLGQLGSGSGNQPFKTIKDYDNWVKRATRFKAWADSAIVYFTKGINAGFILPRSIIEKMIPQMRAIPTADVEKNIFYAPVTNMPASFSDADKKRISLDFVNLIKQQLEPAYKKLGDFLQEQYLPKARTTSGINALPGGGAWYTYLVKQQTTTDKTPDI